MAGKLNHRQSFFSRPANYLWLVVIIILTVGQRVLAAYPNITEQMHARRVFRWLATPIGTVISWLPFSLTEIVFVIGVPLAISLLIVWIVRLVHSREKQTKIIRLSRAVAWTITVVYTLFMLLHGFNYARLPVSETFNLPVEKRSVAELSTMTIDLIERANDARALCEEDENGVFKLRDGVKNTLKTISSAYSSAAEDYPLLDGPAIRPKRVILSRPWSYTGIAGMYMPIWVESNVNIAVPEHDIPETALHEIAHARGFAREDEAGFLAFLAGQYSDNPDIVYSATMGAVVRSLNALAGADQEQYQSAAGRLSDAVRRDLAATSAYWKQFEGPVRETSTQINNAYLKANLQTDGVRSYGRMLDLVLAWYAKEMAW